MGPSKSYFLSQQTRPSTTSKNSHDDKSFSGIHGEHTESEGGVFDISNKIRFGMTEREILNQVITGVNVLSYLEKELSKNA